MSRHCSLTTWLFVNSMFLKTKRNIDSPTNLCRRMLGDIRDLVQRYGREDAHDAERPSEDEVSNDIPQPDYNMLDMNLRPVLFTPAMG